ncbi:HD-GYP domain-containing protein [Photobacterium leiognathi]|uniref:HD-GYP domain-containing protein n=1 Tax=Photobacterium leiognathi TaxID=553611 RepID=UPI0029812862|nr:HD domain-containing phosphohydrolase [Photobacterium leiognathi]
MTKIKSITKVVYLPLLIFSVVFFVLGVDFFYVLSPEIILNLVKVDIISALCIVFLLSNLLIYYFYKKLLIGPLLLLRDQTRKIKLFKYDDVIFVKSNIREISELALSIYIVAQKMKAHEKERQDMIFSFVKSIASAIDAKSPYTAGHCSRVPEITMMLVNAAQSSDLPSLQSFKNLTVSDHKTIELAAWLHDCGKIVTPEHVIDKSVKLETIYNRIHEIRTRFEVLWRDAEIHYYKQVIQSPQHKEVHLLELNNKKHQLTDDFVFIARLNNGEKPVSDCDIKRLKEIASISWFRNFDDTLGLSNLELKNKRSKGKSGYESLLSDKKEHQIIRDRVDDEILAKQHNINMKFPDLLSNNGEIYNLSIKNGTLTEEERFCINEHIIHTIKMLDALPLPQEFKGLPDIATHHHENLLGSGYPRGLNEYQLSIPDRILAIADVFEALTASDRPYKRAKTLSEAIDILAEMVSHGKLDSDIFTLFIKERIYLDYANKYLDPYQIDIVDLERYL